MTDRASAEGLRRYRAIINANGAMEFIEDPDGALVTYADVAALSDTGGRPPSDDGGPRPDSDPWPDLDGADRVCVHGTDTSEECPECGFGFSTPRTETDVQRLALIHRPVTNPMYPRPICEDDGQEWPCKTAIVARLSTPRTETSE